MKTSFFKSILAVAVMMLAVAGAFASDNYVADVTPENGWINTPSACSGLPVSCNTTNGPVCTVRIGQIDHQAFGKPNPLVMSCTKTLYKN